MNDIALMGAAMALNPLTGTHDKVWLFARKMGDKTIVCFGPSASTHDTVYYFLDSDNNTISNKRDGDIARLGFLDKHAMAFIINPAHVATLNFH